MRQNTRKHNSLLNSNTMQAACSTQQLLPSHSQQPLSQPQYTQEYIPEAMHPTWTMPTSLPHNMSFNMMGYSDTSAPDYDNNLPFELSLSGHKTLPLQHASYSPGIPRQRMQYMRYPQTSPYFETNSLPNSRQTEAHGPECASPSQIADWNNIDFQVGWSHLSKSSEMPLGMSQIAFNSSIMSSQMAGNESAPSDCGRYSIDGDIERHCSPSTSLALTKVKKCRNTSRSSVSHRLSTSSKRAKGDKTHSRGRDEQHYSCPVEGCTQKFARKTDLERHNKSVHIKERNHECTYCGRLFARKDTLRRHMEDGCSKRFDIETVTLHPEELQRVFWISSTLSSSMNSISGSTLSDMYL